MARPLIAPGMFTRLHEFYPAQVTIQVVTEPQDAYGAGVPSWANKPGYVELDCRVAPAGQHQAGGGREVKLPDQTYAVSTHTIAITGYYPGIDEKDRAVIGAETFDILLVESDGQSESTRLVAEIVT